MILIAVLVSILVLVSVVGGYYSIRFLRAGKSEVKARLSLLGLRNLREAELSDVLKNDLLSDVPAMNRLLAGMNVAVRIDRRLRQADLKMNVGTFVLLSATLLALGIAAGNLRHWPVVVGLAAGSALAYVPTVVVNGKRRLRLKKFQVHFPDALEMFARSLRAGHSFTGAVQLVAQEMPDPIGAEFERVFDEQNLGVPLRHALTGMAERVDSLDLKFFVTAVLIQRETGGNLAEIIDKIAYVIRERFRVQGQLKIFTAQARMTGVILAFLPIAVAVLVGMLNPDYLKPLWFDKIGRFIVALAVTMQIAGMLVIRKIIRIKI